MAIATITEDAVKAKFPHQAFTPIHGEPDYPSLRKLRAKVYANAAAVTSSFGGGNHGNLGAVMPDPQYFQKTGHHFDPGLDPGEYDLTIFP